MKKKQQKGSLTVEATIILPFYLLTLFFVLNFMNIFYMQLAIQEGLNSTASVLGKYCNVAAVTVGMDSFELSKKNSDSVTALQTHINTFSNDLERVVGILQGGFRLDRLSELIDAGEDMSDSVSNIAHEVAGIGGDDVTNLLLSGAVELAGSAGVTAIMDNYLRQMHVNQSLLEGADGEKLKFFLALDRENHDIVLTAQYRYKDPMFSIFFSSIDMKQSVVVHPWVGGSTPSLYD